MKKVQITRVSDLSGEEAHETVQFALDGTDYEIDLSSGEAAAMRAEVARFTAGARKAGRTARRPAARKASRQDLPDIREFARARGYEINERGRIPGQIVEEYDTMKRYSAARG